MKRRHYHVEDTDGSLSEPIGSFRTAISLAFQYVSHARRQGIWTRWAIDWHSRPEGYHRWRGDTGPAIGDLYDNITVIPCREQHKEVDQ